MTNKRINILLGPILYLLFCFLLPETLFTTLEARSAIGTLVWMAYWWITTTVAPGVTSLLPIVINAFLPMIPMGNVINQYFSEIVVLLFGSSILSLSWGRTGLDKRMASKILTYIGTTARVQAVFWLLLSTFLSMFLPNAVVVAMISPIAVAMLNYIGVTDVKGNSTASMMLMSIAWGAGIGGIATPLGGSMNLVTISYLEKLLGTEYAFADWVIKFLPITVTLIAVTTLYVYFSSPKTTDGGQSKQFFISEYEKLPPMDGYEVYSLLIFLITCALVFIRPLYAEALPGLKPAYLFLASGLLTLLILKKNDEHLIEWKFVEKNMIWDLIFIFAGGLALGELISMSNASQMIGDLIAGAGLTGGIATAAVIVVFTIVMSDVTSNTATAAISIPLIISVIQGMGLNPIPYVYIATIGVNVAFTLPTSVRAVPVAYGMAPKFMIKHGLKITTILTPILIILSYALFL